MSALRAQMIECLQIIPEKQLSALQPLLAMLAHKPFAYETDLTDEEKTYAQEGWEAYERGECVSLEEAFT
jgi:hypothetical protein